MTMECNFSFFHYLPVSQQAMDWGAYVIGAGREWVRPHDDYPPRRHPTLYNFSWSRGRTLPEYQILLINEGQGTFESQAIPARTFESAVCLFLLPGVWHRYRPEPEVGWRERWISFNGELAHRFFKYQQVKSEHCLATLDKKNERRLLRMFDELLDTIHEQPTQNTMILSLKAMSLIAAAVELMAHPEASGSSVMDHAVRFGDALVEQAVERIWTRSHRPLSVEELARDLTVTRRTLDRRFSAAMGHSVLDEINLCRLSRAKRLLRETDLPIKSVVYLSGFSSHERMRVTLAGSEGMSPQEYRAQYRSV
jgi:AraC-like DNA-binding protein